MARRSARGSSVLQCPACAPSCEDFTTRNKITGCDERSSFECIRREYLKLVRQQYPGKGCNAEVMTEIMQVYEKSFCTSVTLSPLSSRTQWSAAIAHIVIVTWFMCVNKRKSSTSMAFRHTARSCCLVMTRSIRSRSNDCYPISWTLGS